MPKQHMVTVLLIGLVGCANLNLGLPGPSASAPPSGQLQNVRINAQQFNAEKNAFQLQLTAEFRVDNPADQAVRIPAHTAVLTAYPASSSAGITISQSDVAPTSVAARGFGVLSYAFDVDLASPDLAPLLGTEARYMVTADANVNLPQAMQATFEQRITQALGATANPSLSSAIRQAATAASADMQSSLPVGLRNGRLQIRHEGSIRLPKPPVLVLADARGTLDLLGPRQLLDLSGLLTAIRDPSQAFLQFMDRAIAGTVNAFPGLNLGSILQTRLGLSRQLTDAVLLVANVGRGNSTGNLGFAERTAARTLLGAFGVSSPSRASGPALSRQTQLELPAVSLVTLLQQLDGGSTNKYQALKNGLTTLLNDPNFNGMTFVPTGMPNGVKLAIPFTLRNPNRFPIEVPNNAAPLGVVNVATLTTRPQNSTGPTAVIPAEGELAMNYEAEFRWDALGQTFIQIAQAGGAKGLAVALNGAMTFDLGYGPTQIPVQPTPAQP